MSGPRRKGNAGGQGVNFRGAPETKTVRDLDPGLGAPNPTILKERRVRELIALTSAPGSWFRVWMPYHLAEMDAEQRLYLPVNRNYVPLGLTTREWVS